MADSSSFKKNTVSGGLWALVRFVMTALLGLPVTIFLVRALPSFQYGVLVIGVSAAGIIGTIVGGGFGSAITLEVTTARGKYREKGFDDIIRAIFTGSLVLMVPALVIVALAEVVFLVKGVSTSEEIVVLILSINSVLAPLKVGATGFLVGQDRPRRAELSSIISTGLYLPAVVIAVLFSRLAIVVAICQVSTQLIATGLLLDGLMQYRSQNYKKNELNGPEDYIAVKAKDLIRSSLKLWASAVGGATLSRLDVFLLGTLKSPLSSALYGPVSSTADLSIGIGALPSSYFMPSARRAILSNQVHEAKRLYQYVTSLGVVLASPVFVLLIIIPSQTLTFLLGNHYGNLETPARILCAGMIVNVILGPNGLVLLAFGKVNIIALRSVIVLCANILLCAFLIPMFGIVGAAFATTVPFAIMNIINSMAIYKIAKIHPWDKSGVAVLIGLLISGGIVDTLEKHLPKVYLVLIGGGLTFAVCSLAMAAVNRKNWKHGKWKELKLFSPQS